MKKIKQSIIIKIIINLSLFIIGYYMVFNLSFLYLNRYTLPSYQSDEKYEDTAKFQSTYLKYIERVAEYVQYKEKGFNSKKLPVKDLEAATNQDYFYSLDEDDYDQYIFEFYNQKLNINKTNFLYYVINTSTNEKYFSPYFYNMGYSGTDAMDNEILQTNLDNFINDIEKQHAYVVINTSSNYYASNIPYKDYINTDNLNWVVNCMKGTLTPEESEKRLNYQWQTNSGTTNGTVLPNIDKQSYWRINDYLIYTATIEDFPNTGDEFYTGYSDYKESTGKYLKAYKMFPIYFIIFAALLSFNIVICGNSRKSKGVRLFWFDKIYTELAALIIIFCCLFCYFMIFTDILQLLMNYIMNFTGKFRIAGLPFGNGTIIDLYIPLYIFCMTGFLSLIRRIKAKTLWTNSLLYHIGKEIKKIIKLIEQHAAFTLKVIITYIIFILVQILGIYFLQKHNNYLICILIFIIAYLTTGILSIKYAADLHIILMETRKITEGDMNHSISTERLSKPFKELGTYINNIGDGLSDAVDEKLKSERLKAELITNVSHDIKTPLTSIINYVDLLSKEKLDNPNASGYLEVLQSKSWRLKTLIEDLVEASKASTGTIPLNLEKINLVELIRQLLGEFEDRFVARQLETNLYIGEEPIYIIADGRSTFRIFENIFSNVNKYALSGTRVYVDIEKKQHEVTVSIKNISANKLNITEEELMERFVRGDLSRNTEGSGLGLSIAKSLAALQNGRFDIILDGDLFKALCTFKTIEQV